jgi:hypothetical protein
MEWNGRNVIDGKLREDVLAVIDGIEFDEGEFLHGTECGVVSLSLSMGAGKVVSLLLGYKIVFTPFSASAIHHLLLASW